MDFNFDWNYVAAGAPYITISELGLGFNSPAISLLGNPDEVAVGFDNAAMVIGVKRYDDSESAKSYKFSDRVRNGWVRIGCKDFVKQLASLTGMKFSPAIRYVAKFDEKEQILYISVLEGRQKDEVAEEERGTREESL